MKKFIPLFLSIALLSSACPLIADDLETVQQDQDNIWRVGAGAQDGAYTSIASSMLGWGLGLAVGIGVLASVLHQSTASTAHNTCH